MSDDGQTRPGGSPGSPGLTLVTGASGNTGRAVVESLVRAGLPVRAASRKPGGIRPPLPRPVETVALDFTRPELFPAALDGVTNLFLMRPPDLTDMGRTLVPFLNEAARAGVDRVLFLSVVGADEKRFIPHARVERYLTRSGLSWTFLRAGFFAQNLGDQYRADIRDDNRLYVAGARGRCAYVDVRDIGEVVCRLLVANSHRSEALHLSGAESLRFDEAAALLTELLGRPIRYQPASMLGHFLHFWRRRGLPWMSALIHTLIHVAVRSGAGEVVDPTLGALLGRPPRPLRTYIADHAHLWRR